jgi:hypothetical protein
MPLSNHRSHRLALHAVAAASLGTTLFLASCGESDAVSNAGVSSPAAPEISLDAAIMQGDDHAVHAHILAGTPVNTKTMTGDTPLHVAAALGRGYAAELLIGAGADLETANSSGATPLFNAAFFCHADVLGMLIDAGANKEVTDQTGTSIRQIMELPWEQIRPIYEMVHNSIGLPFDEQRIRDARPGIAEMLR